MTQEFCHICKEGNKECVETDTKGKIFLEIYDVKCSKCGKPLIP